MNEAQTAKGKMCFMPEKDIREKIDALLEKANALKYIDSQHTIEISNDALYLCEKTGYTLGEKVAKSYMAYAYNNIGNYEKALDLVYDSLHFFIKEGFYDLQWFGYNLLGITFCDLGDIEKSMDFYHKAQTIALEMDSLKKYDNNSTSKRALTLTLNNIAENYKLINDYKEALIYSESAYNIDTQFDYSLSRGLSILTLGEIYYLLDDYEKANSLSSKALQYLKHHNYALFKADAYKLIALTSWKKGNYPKADEYFCMAINLNEKESIPNYQIDALISYYEYLRYREKSPEALDILMNACNLSIKYNITEKVSKISLLLSIFYGDSGDYESSFKYIQLHDQYEKKYIESYNKNIIRSLSIKKKMQEIEYKNDKILKKNEDLKLKSQSLQMIVDKISIISELGQKITSTLNKDLILDMLYSSIKTFMDLSHFRIGLYDEKNSIINYLDDITNGKKRKIHSLSINEKPSFAGNCINNSQFIIVNDLNKEFTKYIDEETYKTQLNLDDNSELNSLMFCPLIVNTKIIGVMTIQSKGKNTFTPYHIEMIKALSSYAAIAINNAIKSMELEMEVAKTKGVQVELEKLNEKLLFVSENDSLTGISNRRKFDIYINDVWDITIEERTSMSLLLIDIDYFKEYNDNLGHLEGDKCLVSVARLLAKLNNEKYFLARFGGDEFVIVLLKCSIDQAIEFGENLRNKMLELNIPHKFSPNSDRVTLSIGVASVIPNKNIVVDELIRKADEALYIAKKYGRNRVSTDVVDAEYTEPQRRNTDFKR